MKKVYSILDYGAKANSDTIQTECFQKALDACFLAGGGEVIVPTGEYIIGDIRIRSNTILHLMEHAILIGSKNPADYLHINEDVLEPLPKEQNTGDKWCASETSPNPNKPFKNYLYTAGSYWNYGMIRAVSAENIAIIGEQGSKINGNNVFDPNGEAKYRGPHAINMHYCKNVKFSGYTVENSSNWAHAIFQSQNITFENLTVLAGHDALHTRSCCNVLMQNCKLITGDDAIAGFNNIDVVIKNCEISTACSAFRFGGNNILVENCYVYGPCQYQFRGSFSYEEKIAGLLKSERGRNNMLSFWTNFVSNDLPVIKPAGNIIIRNCIVKNADRMLHLNLSGNEPWQNGLPPTDIIFENIKIENVKMGLTAYGVEGSPMKLTLKNVEYSFSDGFEETPMFRLAHCDEVNLENVKITNNRGRCLILCWSNGMTVNAHNLDCEFDIDELVMKATEQFVCKAI